MKQIWYRKTRMVLMASVLFLLASCIDGYHDDWTFSSGVKNTTLLSPDSSKVTFTRDNVKKTLQVSWPVVQGASGYQFSLYIVDDPANPVAVGTENEIVDGCSVKRALKGDTKYKAVIKALGNESVNNKDAVKFTTALYSTLLPAFKVIPDGSDLYQFFIDNPIPADSTNELAYELVPNGKYTLSAPLDFQTHWITLRGDKIYHPTVTYTSAGRLRTTSGLTLKYMDMDCGAIGADVTDGAMLLLSATPDPKILNTTYNSYYILTKDIYFFQCNFININRRLVFDANIKYCLKNFMIEECKIQLNALNDANGGIIYMQGGFVNSFTILNSTVWGNTQSAGYFLRYNNSGRPDRAGFVNGSIRFLNNTFYNVVYSGQMGNYSGMNSLLVTLNLAKNIFVDCGSGQVVRRLSASTTTMVRDLSDNCYWYNGTSPEAQEIIATYGDKSKSAYCADPLFLNASTGDFTIGAGATKVLTQKSGDPRWLPAQ